MRFDRCANISFTTDTGRLGTFYAGWREVVTNEAVYTHLLNPPIFDSVSPAGDYDADGDVDNNDYAVWRSEFGQTASPAGSGADGNINGIVDAADYVIWRRNHTGAGAQTGLPQVPEPCRLALACMALMSISLAARSRRAT